MTETGEVLIVITNARHNSADYVSPSTESNGIARSLPIVYIYKEHNCCLHFEFLKLIFLPANSGSNSCGKLCHITL